MLKFNILYLLIAIYSLRPILLESDSTQQIDSVTSQKVTRLTNLVPKPILEKGTTIVRMHFLNLKQRPFSNIQLELTPLIAREQQTYNAEIDAVTSSAVFTLQLEGTAKCILSNAAIPMTTDIYLAPGETIDIWCDIDEVLKRDKQLEEEILKAQLTLKEGVESIPSPVMNIIPVTTNGHYAAVNNHDRIFSDSSADIGSVSQRHFSTAFASSAEAATSLTNDYMSMCRQITDSPGFEMQKALSIIELRLLTAFTAATSGNISDRSDLKAIFEILDLNDTRLLLGKHVVMAASALYNHRDILPDCPLTEYYEVIMDKAMLHVLHPGTTQLP